MISREISALFKALQELYPCTYITSSFMQNEINRVGFFKEPIKIDRILSNYLSNDVYEVPFSIPPCIQG